MKQEERAARLVWQYGEPTHAVLFFAPETQSATDALGLKGGWMSYFGCRAAPLGAVSAPVVTSIFYGFHPLRVASAMREAMRPLAERIMSAGVVPKLNNMGLPWPHQ